MKNNIHPLTGWAINKIKTEYPDDVALLIAVEGHSVNGDGHGECFDYFVPATERGKELSQTFIIDGVGHDLYPRTWERVERTADLEENTMTLGNAAILYSRSREDEERFLAIRRKLFDNLADGTFTYQKALERLDIAMDLYRTMMFEEKEYKVRMACGYIHGYLTESVAFIGGTYPKDARNGQIPQLRQLEALPENFIEYYRALLGAQSVNELKSLAHLLIGTTREFLSAKSPNPPPLQKAPDFAGLAEWYQELSLAWRRLRYYCDTGNSDAAFVDALYIQNEANIIGEEFGLREMALLDVYDAANLPALRQRADEIEEYIVSAIEGHGVKIRSFATLEEFLMQN